MNYFDYEVDHSGNKRIVFLRAIIQDAKSDLVYIVPTTLAATLSIPIEVIESVLAYLESHEYIEINERPNHRLTTAQRLRRDDEQDYYVVTLYKEFFVFYDKVEEVAPFLNANADITKPEEQSTMLASIRLENDLTPVVNANNIVFKLPNMTSGSPLQVVTYGLSNPQKTLTIEQLRAQSIHGIANINELLRKTLFGKNKPLACFVSATPQRVTFYQEAYINNTQLETIRSIARSVSE